MFYSWKFLLQIYFRKRLWKENFLVCHYLKNTYTRGATIFTAGKRTGISLDQVPHLPMWVLGCSLYVLSLSVRRTGGLGIALTAGTHTPFIDIRPSVASLLDVRSCVVCLSVCLSRSWALQKRLNWSRCYLGCGLGWLIDWLSRV